MKTIILCLALISLAVAAQKPALQKDRQVLFDFRVADETTPARIPPATQRMVLTKVFRKYLTDANRCNFQGELGDDEQEHGCGEQREGGEEGLGA